MKVSMTPITVNSSQTAPQSRSPSLQVFGDKLGVEEKLQVLDALVSASEKKSGSVRQCSFGINFQTYDDDKTRPRALSDLQAQGSFACNYCDKVYQTARQYYGHIKIHKRRKPRWICSKCPNGSSAFKTLALLRKHEKSSHKEPVLYQCNYCDDTFFHISTRETHQNTNHSSAYSKFTCQFCDKIFNKRSDLRSHLASHLSLQSCICEVCGRSFNHVSNLIRHSYLHSGEKPYPCNTCGKRFTQLTSLKQHKISHHDNLSLPCPALPQQCDKVFRTPLLARQHAYRSHPDVLWDDQEPKPFELKQQRSFYCRDCGEAFHLMKDLKAHKQKHVMSRNEIDEDEMATPLSSRNQHSINNHDNDNLSIACPCALPLQCEKVFRFPLLARQHAYKAHPDIMWNDTTPYNNNLNEDYVITYQLIKALENLNIGHAKSSNKSMENVKSASLNSSVSLEVGSEMHENELNCCNLEGLEPNGADLLVPLEAGSKMPVDELNCCNLEGLEPNRTDLPVLLEAGSEMHVDELNCCNLELKPNRDNLKVPLEATSEISVNEFNCYCIEGPEPNSADYKRDLSLGSINEIEVHEGTLKNYGHFGLEGKYINKVVENVDNYPIDLSFKNVNDSNKSIEILENQSLLGSVIKYIHGKLNIVDSPTEVFFYNSVNEYENIATSVCGESKSAAESLADRLLVNKMNDYKGPSYYAEDQRSAEDTENCNFPDLQLNSEQKDCYSSNLLRSVLNEIEETVDTFEVCNLPGSDLKRIEDHVKVSDAYSEDQLKHCINEIDSTAMAYDENIVLCINSPGNRETCVSFRTCNDTDTNSIGCEDKVPIPEEQNKCESTDLQCLNTEGLPNAEPEYLHVSDDFKCQNINEINTDTKKSHFKNIPNEHKNYKNLESSEVLFGDSYSALLKEIGISEDETYDSQDCKKQDDFISQDDAHCLNTEPSILSFGENYSVLLKEIGILEEETSVTQQAHAKDILKVQTNFKNMESVALPARDENMSQGKELRNSNYNSKTSQEQKPLFTMEFSDEILSLLPETNEPEIIVMYVTQEDGSQVEVWMDPVMETLQVDKGNSSGAKKYVPEVAMENTTLFSAARDKLQSTAVKTTLPQNSAKVTKLPSSEVEEAELKSVAPQIMVHLQPGNVQSTELERPAHQTTSMEFQPNAVEKPMSAPQVVVQSSILFQDNLQQNVVEKPVSPTQVIIQRPISFHDESQQNVEEEPVCPQVIIQKPISFQDEFQTNLLEKPVSPPQVIVQSPMFQDEFQQIVEEEPMSPPQIVVQEPISVQDEFQPIFVAEPVSPPEVIRRRPTLFPLGQEKLQPNVVKSTVSQPLVIGDESILMSVEQDKFQSTEENIITDPAVIEDKTVFMSLEQDKLQPNVVENTDSLPQVIESKPILMVLKQDEFQTSLVENTVSLPPVNEHRPILMPLREHELPPNVVENTVSLPQVIGEGPNLLPVGQEEFESSHIETNVLQPLVIAGQPHLLSLEKSEVENHWSLPQAIEEESVFFTLELNELESNLLKNNVSQPPVIGERPDFLHLEQGEFQPIVKENSVSLPPAIKEMQILWPINPDEFQSNVKENTTSLPQFIEERSILLPLEQDEFQSVENPVSLPDILAKRPILWPLEPDKFQSNVEENTMSLPPIIEETQISWPLNSDEFLSNVENTALLPEVSAQRPIVLSVEQDELQSNDIELCMSLAQFFTERPILLPLEEDEVQSNVVEGTVSLPQGTVEKPFLMSLDPVKLQPNVIEKTVPQVIEKRSSDLMLPGSINLQPNAMESPVPQDTAKSPTFLVALRTDELHSNGIPVTEAQATENGSTILLSVGPVKSVKLNANVNELGPKSSIKGLLLSTEEEEDKLQAEVDKNVLMVKKLTLASLQIYKLELSSQNTEQKKSEQESPATSVVSGQGARPKNSSETNKVKASIGVRPNSSSKKSAQPHKIPKKTTVEGQGTKSAKKPPNRPKRECPECGKVFFKTSNLNQHLGMHFPNMKNHKCTQCDQSFSWKSSLNKHMVNAHKMILKDLLCDVCGKQYKNANQIKQHKMRDHQNLRPHECKTCTKTFFRKYDLQIHQRIHANTKPYMCEICGMRFNHSSHLHRHEKVEKGKKQCGEESEDEEVVDDVEPIQVENEVEVVNEFEIVNEVEVANEVVNRVVVVSNEVEVPDEFDIADEVEKGVMCLFND